MPALLLALTVTIAYALGPSLPPPLAEIHASFRLRGSSGGPPKPWRRLVGGRAEAQGAKAGSSSIDRPRTTSSSLEGSGVQQSDPQSVARQRMVDTQLRPRGIRNEAVLKAITKVPRHLFVPPDLRHRAYEDTPLPIGLGQTISQPFIVAYMTEALQLSPEHTVLEIGTGSGYQAAVLAELVREVYTIEILPELADRARKTLADAGYRNVNVRTGNGYLGWPERAPFPRIIVTAAPDTIPEALVDQLAVGGTMVLPVGTLFQEMTIVTKTAQGLAEKRTIPVRFVPMVNKPGY